MDMFPIAFMQAHPDWFEKHCNEANCQIYIYVGKVAPEVLLDELYKFEMAELRKQPLPDNVIEIDFINRKRVSHDSKTESPSQTI